MPYKAYWASDLTGGGTGALDKIDGADLADKDIALVILSTGDVYEYWLDDDSAASESSPDIIAPDANGGDKRWLLKSINNQDVSSDATVTFGTINALTLAAQSVGFTIAGGTTSKTLTVAETLTLDGASGKTLTLEENLTLANGYDFTLQALGQANSLILNESLTIGDGNDGTITFSAASKTVTVAGSCTLNDWFDQAVKAASTPAFAGLSLTGNLALAANSITGTSVDISNVELQQLSLIGATTISGAQWGYLGSSTVAGGAMMDAADAAAQRTLLSVENGATADQTEAEILTLLGLTAAEVDQVGNIAATTISEAQWGYLGGASANGGALIDAADYAAMMALLTGQAGAAFSFNSQALTSVGAIGCGAVTATATFRVNASVDVNVAADVLIGSSISGYRDDIAKIQVQRDASQGQGWNFLVTNYAGTTSEALLIGPEGNVDITDHDAATIGLTLGGTLVEVSAAELNYSEGVTSAIQTQLDVRCLESVLGTSIGASLLLDGAVLKASAILQKYHGVDPAVNVLSFLGAADYAAMMALLTGQAGAAFSFNSQALTSVGTIGCGDITTTGDYLLANGNYVGISAAERLEFYSAGYAAFMGCVVGVGTATPTANEAYNRLTIAGTDNTALTFGIENAGTGQTAFVMRRDGGTVARWYQYLPGSSTDYRLYCGSDRVIFGATGDVDIVSHDAATVGLKLGSTLVTASAAELNEAGTFFASTDISAAEAETLTDTSDADALHTHDTKQSVDATLTAFASLLTAANKIPYATGADTGSELDLATTVGDPGSDTTLVSEQGIREAIVSATTLAALTDTTITGPADLDLLQYDNGSSKWVDRTFAEAGVAANTFTAINALLAAADAAVDFNTQNLTGLGTIASAAGTLTIDETVALSAKAPLASPSFTGTPLAPDHGAAATDMLVNVCYGTGAPPAVETTTIGSLFIKYVA